MYKCVCCCSIYGHEINLLDRRRVCRVDLSLCSHRNSFRWDFQNWPLDNSPCEKSRHEANRSHLVYLSLDYMFWTFALPETCMWMRHYRISGIGRGCRSGMVWKNTKNDTDIDESCGNLLNRNPKKCDEPLSDLRFTTISHQPILMTFSFARSKTTNRRMNALNVLCGFFRIYRSRTIKTGSSRLTHYAKKKGKNSRSCGKSYFSQIDCDLLTMNIFDLLHSKIVSGLYDESSTETEAEKIRRIRRVSIVTEEI